MATFDRVASDFDRFRALPSGVPEVIRAAVFSAVGAGPGLRLLDLGAGTGRVGAAFVAAGDGYIGVDPSAGMLAEFAARVAGPDGSGPRLTRADGRALPFSGASFDAVLLVQVLSGVPGWRRVLSEARRVLRPGGALVLGQTAGPPDGLDARLREELSALMEGAGVDGKRQGAGRDEARATLAAGARRHDLLVAARWEARRTPRGFLERHRTGARFASLPAEVGEDLLRRLADRAVEVFGDLDAPSVEAHSFELDVFRF